MTDRTEEPHDELASKPAQPPPAAATRTAAAGVFLAAFALACAAVAVLAARDKGCDERQFQATWRLNADGARWTVTDRGAATLESNHC